MVIFERFLCSCRLQSSLLIDFSLEEKVAGSAIRLSFQRAPHEASPHQTKRARPRRASLGIFNTAGYEVLIALFLTSQIPFLSLSLSPRRPLPFHSLFVSPLQTACSSVPVLLSPLCRTATLYCLSLSILNLSLPVPLFYSLSVSLRRRVT